MLRTLSRDEISAVSGGQGGVVSAIDPNTIYEPVTGIPVFGMSATWDQSSGMVYVDVYNDREKAGGGFVFADANIGTFNGQTYDTALSASDFGSTFSFDSIWNFFGKSTGGDLIS
jgi:hypothetical protein